jgi:hypothetical protein
MGGSSHGQTWPLLRLSSIFLVFLGVFVYGKIKKFKD